MFCRYNLSLVLHALQPGINLIIGNDFRRGVGGFPICKEEDGKMGF